MTYRRIKPTPNASCWHLNRPSLYRACVTGNRKEYDECEQKIIAAYNKVNKKERL